MYGLDMVGCTWKFSKQLCSESLHLNHFIFSILWLHFSKNKACADKKGCCTDCIVVGYYDYVEWKGIIMDHHGCLHHLHSPTVLTFYVFHVSIHQAFATWTSSKWPLLEGTLKRAFEVTTWRDSRPSQMATPSSQLSLCHLQEGSNPFNCSVHRMPNMSNAVVPIAPPPPESIASSSPSVAPVLLSPDQQSWFLSGTSVT